MGDLIKPSRRGLITGLASLIAAPALVRASSLMPVRRLPPAVWTPSALPNCEVIGSLYRFSADRGVVLDGTGEVTMWMPGWLPDLSGNERHLRWEDVND